MKTMNFEPVIGLEVHVELATASKMFCGCPADHFARESNTITCPVCLGLPGALPVPNRKAVEWTILLGLASGCTIQEESKFDRKNYFYPDLPKGYQISQYDQPLAINGSLVIARSESSSDAAISNNRQIASPSERSRNDKTIRIRRVHLEEDTGKLQHAVVDGRDVSLVDFNRSGVPLVEIVTEPDFRSVEEVDQFVRKVQQIVRYLGISGADMEKGSMRIEPSISILPITNTTNNKYPNYRVEIKNINSFKFVRRAIEYEIKRQTEMLEKGEAPTQQTRGWNEGKGITIAQREKEEAHDYRYFPEPDIPPMRFTRSRISDIRSQIEELPDTKKERFMKKYELGEYDVTILTETRERAEYFEESVKASLRLRSGQASGKRQEVTAKALANWIINKKIDTDGVSPSQLVDQLAQFMQTSSISDEDLEKIIKEVLAQNQKAVEDYKKGKEQALMFLVGQVLRAVKGKGDSQKIQSKIIEILYQ